MKKLVTLSISAVFFLLVGSDTWAQTPHDLDNVEPSVTDAARIEFYMTRLFLKCESAPGEVRKYKLTIKPISLEKKESHIMDITREVTLPNIPGTIEESTLDRVTGVSNFSVGNWDLVTDRGSMRLRTQPLTGVTQGEYTIDDQPNIQLNCVPTKVICQTSDSKKLPNFFVILTPYRAETPMVLVDITEKLLPSNMTGDPIVGYTTRLAEGGFNLPSMTFSIFDDQEKPVRRNKLSVAFSKANKSFVGKLTFKALLGTKVKNQEMACRNGI